MKRVTYILLGVSILSLVGSIFFWLDSIQRNINIYNDKLSNYESICYEEHLFLEGLVDYLAQKKNITLGEIKSFFTDEKVTLINQIDDDNFDWNSTYLKNKKQIDNINFDTIYQLKSRSVFFLFNKTILVSIVTGCQKENRSEIKNYIKLKGEYLVDD